MRRCTTSPPTWVAWASSRTTRPRACCRSLINTHLLDGRRATHGLERFFYASSACVYAAGKQTDPTSPPDRELTPTRPMPEDGYGWEKLFGERMCRHFHEDFGLEPGSARYHNVYGPYGTWDGGREKAPAAICRKVAEAALTGDHEIEVWGDGEQTRSLHVHRRLRRGHPATHGIATSASRSTSASAELVTINQLGRHGRATSPASSVTRRHNLDAPQGVRGRNSDNTLIRERLGWEPTVSLRTGLEKTYEWIRAEMVATL